MLALGVTVLLLLLLASGLPVSFALAVAGAVGLFVVGGSGVMLGVLKTTPLAAASSYELIAVPMFLLMAEFVVVSGVAADLFRAASVWVGRAPAGLAIATALTGAGFGAISGSSTASAATLSATSIPAMIEHGYERRLASGVVAISGTLAMLIPPSIALVFFGLVAEVSIGKLLVGGVVPGLLVCVTIIATVLVLVALDPARAPRGRRYAMREKLESLRVTGPMLLLFAAVTGVIYTGIATPTEAAAIGAFGAFVLAIWTGSLTPATVRVALTHAAHTTCMVMLIIAAAHIFGYFLTITQTTQDIVKLISNLDTSRWVILALLLGVYLVLGCFLDQLAIIILTVPVALPIVVALGFDPVWFGVLVVVTGEVGMVTPPVGLNVFVVAQKTGMPVMEVFAGVWPHVYAHLVIIAILAAFPILTLWLPSTMR